MCAQVTAVTKSSNYHLRNIGKVRKYLSTDACKTAVQTLVVSRLDYCSALLSGITVQQVNRLQLTLNKAARLITLTPRSEHITPVLASLHWLPCRLRIQFRILTYVYKCLHDTAPLYLQDLLQIYTPARPLRSAADTSVLVSKNALKKVGEQAFQHAGPNLWNSIPSEIRNSPSLKCFKTKLKTYFFKQHYT